MSSTKTILILLGLIVGLNLGLRYGWGPLAGSDRSDQKEGANLADEVSSEGAIASDPFDSAIASGPRSNLTAGPRLPRSVSIVDRHGCSRRTHASHR